MIARIVAVAAIAALAAAAPACASGELEDDALRPRGPVTTVIQGLSDRQFQRELIPGLPVRFDIRMLAGQTFRTQAITPIRGDTIEVQVPPHL